MFPAVGQGALGLECRAADETTRALLAPLNDPPTRAAVLAERAFLRGLGGGCLVPIGALGRIVDGMLHLAGTILPVDGRQRVEGRLAGPSDVAETLGQKLAEILLGEGGRELLPQA
jgi:hydroxymethylbilane synthase